MFKRSLQSAESLLLVEKGPKRHIHEPCLTGLQSSLVEVSLNTEGARGTFGARLKPGLRLGQKMVNCFGGAFPAQRRVEFPRMQQGQSLAVWLLG